MVRRLALVAPLVGLVALVCSIGFGFGSVRMELSDDETRIERGQERVDALERVETDRHSLLVGMAKDLEWIKWRLGWRRDAP